MIVLVSLDDVASKKTGAVSQLLDTADIIRHHNIAIELNALMLRSACACIRSTVRMHTMLCTKKEYEIGVNPTVILAVANVSQKMR